MDTNTENHWHLDKKVPISLLFAIMVQAAMVIWAFADLRKDIELIKADIGVLHQRDDTQSAALREAITQTREQYKTLDAKLDRLIEREMKNATH